MSNYIIPVQLPGLDGPEPKLGDGVSRPMPKERTREFRLMVQIPGSKPMRVVIPAPTKAKAVTYCKNRWPLATVTPLDR